MSRFEEKDHVPSGTAKRFFGPQPARDVHGTLDFEPREMLLSSLF
jgi:hypothetical protein